MENLKLCKKMGVWSRITSEKVRQYGDAYEQLPYYQQFQHKTVK